MPFEKDIRKIRRALNRAVRLKYAKRYWDKKENCFKYSITAKGEKHLIKRGEDA